MRRLPERLGDDAELRRLPHEPLRLGAGDLHLGPAAVHPAGLVPHDAAPVEVAVEHRVDRRGRPRAARARRRDRLAVQLVREPLVAEAGRGPLEEAPHDGGLGVVDHAEHVGPLAGGAEHLHVR